MKQESSSKNPRSLGDIVRPLFFGTVALGTIAATFYGFTYYEPQRLAAIERTKQNLAPNAVYSDEFLPITGGNLDVNKDGTIESIMEIRNPKTGKRDLLLIEFNGSHYRARPFEVVDGKIKYLDE